MDTKDIGNYILYTDGRVFSKRTNEFTNGCLNRDGYSLVCIDGKQLKRHRIIAAAFIPNPENHPVVNHKNAIKTDNSVENLEWCSIAHNVRHAFRNGLMVRHKGSRNAASKLKEADVVEIKRLLREGVTMTAIGKMFNVTIHCIFRIKKGFNWGYLT